MLISTALVLSGQDTASLTPGTKDPPTVRQLPLFCPKGETLKCQPAMMHGTLSSLNHNHQLICQAQVSIPNPVTSSNRVHHLYDMVHLTSRTPAQST